jgi:hypothetical protein
VAKRGPVAVGVETAPKHRRALRVLFDVDRAIADSKIREE